MTEVDEKFPLNSILQPLMEKVGLNSWTALSQSSGVSIKQLRRIRQGKIDDLKMSTLRQLATALHIGAPELLSALGQLPDPVTELRQEYDRLQLQLKQQHQELKEGFERESLDQLESWLRYWPIAVAKVEQQANIKPNNLVKLVKPVEHLVQSWGLEAIGAVGDRIPYDPQWHQLTQGRAEPGSLVTVVMPGYRYQQKLLFRAEVSIS
ncbi:MAG: helix-turn-helix domain-containing protein [Roseofilum sp. SBFL]|uniref:helix-turn-helix domain-containing protein n=1 Tax=unclassified Roseofilum TaxID=2620099 RepID=UPI001B1A3B0A|nr:MULTISPECIES: helix-turn-helix domain-containing protein [unclassified Roseofilum]MBP0014360.1 helix-turn-helix domain-containing protein [Roseofilum sp. SID3]MBP0022525.1 helix-turn-helix domain-containing protein [Roseofilum sp. SID2]MBP0038810.1 helix-turn-helix domain-containing protein [Roseofilum sp. SID1]MBP0042209.1 helix-turn-helix domain-containing protein [Roseofilum sp. SBFL]